MLSRIAQSGGPLFESQLETGYSNGGGRTNNSSYSQYMSLVTKSTNYARFEVVNQLIRYSRIIPEKIILLLVKKFRILWNTQFHCRVHNYAQLFPILDHIKTVYDLSLHFFNIILPYTPKSLRWSRSFVSSSKPCMHFSQSLHITCSHYPH